MEPLAVLAARAMSDRQCPMCGETRFPGWDHCPACGYPYPEDDDGRGPAATAQDPHGAGARPTSGDNGTWPG